MNNTFFQSTLKISFFFAAFFSIFSTANAAGVLDKTFGTNGRVATAMNYQTQARAFLIQPDGKIVVVGDAAPTSGAKRDIAYARYNANGTLDSTFAFGGRAFVSFLRDNDSANAVALQPDGKIVIVGTTQPTPGSTNTDFLIVRLNKNGSLDSQFGNLGYITINQGMFDDANSVAIQSDGKIVVAGNTSDTVGNIGVFRLNQNGSIDTSFANSGFMYYNFNIPGEGTSNVFTKNVAVLPNGRILVGSAAVRPIIGQNASFKGTVLLMLQNNGTLAQDFGGGGIAYYVYPVSDSGYIDFDFAFLPNGNIMTVSTKNVLYSSFGSIEGTFPSASLTTNTDIAVRSDGKYVTLNGGIHSFELSGTYIYSPEHRFIGGASLNGTDIAVQPDNKTVIISSTATEFVVTRLNAFTSQATRIADYDRDEKTDLAVLRPSNSALYTLQSTSGAATYNSGEASLAIRRVIPENYGNLLSFPFPNSFPFTYWKTNGNIGNSPGFFCGTDGENKQCFQWGLLGDISVGGDYNGDRATYFAVFRPSNGIWYFYLSAYNQTSAIQWGINGDKPVPADYDYDGITDIAVYRPSTGTWWIRRSSDGGSSAIRFGIASDIPLTGDFDGDGKADLTVYRASEGNWYQLLTTEGFRVVRFGIATDSPVPGDYDGDGRHDIAVFREGVWYISQSTDGLKIVQWGNSGDSPIAVRYDQ